MSYLEELFSSFEGTEYGHRIDVITQLAGYQQDQEATARAVVDYWEFILTHVDVDRLAEEAPELYEEYIELFGDFPEMAQEMEGEE